MKGDGIGISSNMGLPEILDFRNDALLVRFGRNAGAEVSGRAQAFWAALDRALPNGVVETAPALASVLVRFDPAQVKRSVVRDALRQVAESFQHGDEDAPQPKRRWTVPACFDGDYAPQLSETATLMNLSPEQAVAELCATDLRVLAIGFAPGQPYLGLLPEAWDLPRQSDLNPRVKAGAVATAVRQIVLFANDSPTGWRHVGQSAFRPFQPSQVVSFPLRPGDALTFEPVSANDFQAIEAAGDLMGGARCEDVG